MRARVSWRAAADADVADVFARIDADSPIAAERFLEALEDAIEILRVVHGARDLPRLMRDER